jgi:putrescine importer
MTVNHGMPDVEQFGYKQELKRTLGVRNLVIFGMVFMAPVSSMTLFGLMSEASGGNNVICYVIAFVAMLFTALSYSQMVQAFPVAGSVYSYTQRSISPALGFIGGWAITLSYFLTPMFLYLISSIFAHALIPAIPIWVWLIIYVIPCMIINIVGIEVVSKVNIVMTGIMVAAILSFVVTSIRYAALGTEHTRLFSSAAVVNLNTINFNGVLRGTILAVLSYLGFDAITTLSEEAKVTPKKIGLAIILACTLQTVLYLLIAYFGNVVAPSVSELSSPDSAFFEICAKVGGSWLQLFVTLVIIISGFATALAGQSSASRVLFGMGRDNLIPKRFFAYLHPRFKTPIFNILTMGVIGLIGALLFDVNVLSNLVAFGGLFGFMLVNLSVIVHYFVKVKTGKVLAHLIFPAVGTTICILFLLLGMSILAKIVGFSWIFLGIIYLAIRSSKKGFRELLKSATLSE